MTPDLRYDYSKREQDKKGEDNKYDDGKNKSILRSICIHGVLTEHFSCIALHAVSLSADVVRCVTLDHIIWYLVPVLHYMTMFMYSITRGRMKSVCGSWIRWLVSRIRSGADQLRGDWESIKHSERPTATAMTITTAKTLGRDCCRFRCCYYARRERALPLQNEQRNVE